MRNSCAKHGWTASSHAHEPSTLLNLRALHPTHSTYKRTEAIFHIEHEMQRGARDMSLPSWYLDDQRIDAIWESGGGPVWAFDVIVAPNICQHNRSLFPPPQPHSFSLYCPASVSVEK